MDLPAARAARRLARRNLKAAIAARARMGHKSDPGAMHDLRVALRRLRVILRAYAPFFADGIYGRFRKRLRVLAHATNVARDAEVQLEWMDSAVRSPRPAERLGRRWLRAHLVSQRKLFYRKFRSEALPEFDRLARKMRHALESKPIGPRQAAVRRQVTFAQAAGRQVRQSTAVLAGDLRRIGSAEDEAEVHVARIEAKRLRYLVEPLVRGEKAERVLEPLRALQDSLGDLHDRHVMAQLIVWALKDGLPRDSRRDLVPGLKAVAQQNRQEAGDLREDITRRFLGGRARALLRAPRDLARQLAAQGAVPARHHGRVGRG